MPTHTVAQGENLSRIAKEHGLPNWRVLAKANPELFGPKPGGKGRDPNMIFPGDVLNIPGEEEEVVFHARTDRWHTFLAHKEHTKLELVIEDRAGHLLPFARYELKVECRKSPSEEFNGRTDKSAELNLLLAEDAESGHLKVWVHEGEEDEELHEWDLQIHHLDPPEELTGVQARLKNLGLYTKKVDNDMGKGTLDAIHEFKAMFGMEQSDELTEEFIAKLAEVHGS